MKNVGAEQQRASNRLASGYRINNAADDAAGLGISETMRAQIRGLDQASRNAQDAQAMINTAEGGLQEITNMLQRVRELTVQAANDTNVQTNHLQIENEVNQLHQEIGATRDRVQFNTRNLLNNAGDDIHFQIGANTGQGITHDFDQITTKIDLALTKVATVKSELLLAAKTGADMSAHINLLQTEIDNISSQRAILGALSNRLDYTVRNLDISSENLQDAESRVRNTDMAREMMRFTMSNVLQQASVSMLSQANQMPNNLLQLLR